MRRLVSACLVAILVMISLNVGTTVSAEGEWAVPLNSPKLTVLLYTDAAKDFSFTKGNSEGGDIIGRDIDWFRYSGQDGGDFLICEEINIATEKCFTGSWGAMEARCALRECVRYFDISKDELMQAFKTMKENPDAIRPILYFLTDEEFNSAKRYDGTFGVTEWPQEIIDAMYIEDDAEAHRILCKPYAVYVPELGRVVSALELFDHFWPMSVDELTLCDLTSDEMGAFLEYAQKEFSDDDDVDDQDGRTNYEKIEYLEAARGAQLAAAKTGDGAASALWVVVAAIPVLATVVWAKRKRRI